MSEGSTPTAPVGPGDTRPATLARPPAERYATPALARGRTVEPASPRRARLLVVELVVSLIVAAVFAVGIANFDLRWPLLVVAAVGGWLIGWTAWRVAWPQAVRDAAPQARLGVGRVTGSAVAFSLAAWFVGQVGGWALSLWLLPNSSLSFSDRLSSTPFLDWLGPQFGPLEVMELLLISGLAWFAARPRWRS